MAINIAQNFDYNSEAPNFARDQFDSIQQMKETTFIDKGHISFCKEDEKHYKFKGLKDKDGNSNTPDPTLGYWEEFKTGGDDVESIPNQFIESLFFVDANS